MVRSIIAIDEQKCTGCGLCIPNCPEGALQVIDGKARLVSDLMCDGLGACLGHCPEGAITISEREAGEYDEAAVMVNIVKAGPATIRAHLDHLRDHGQTVYLARARQYLEAHGVPIPEPAPSGGHRGCPGSRSMAFAQAPAPETDTSAARQSQLTHWPVQMHLINPRAPHYHHADILLAADCVAYSLGDFHRDHLHGRKLAIACPKLDDNQGVYEEKIRALIDEAKINTLTVMTMEVPCCGGLLRLAQSAVAAAQRKVPVKSLVVGIEGGVLKEEWV